MSYTNKIVFELIFRLSANFLAQAWYFEFKYFDIE